ncbi:NUDIX domain-containing protein [Thalassiella azotivora]
MASGDGNGWVQCRCGHRHWGLHGAAGLLLTRDGSGSAGPDTGGADTGGADTGGADTGGAEVLLQLRAAWTHLGGTWGLPGGAVDSHEDHVAGALREAHEEAAVPPEAVQVLATVVSTDHGDWAYRVVVGRLRCAVRPRATTAESDDVRWVPAAQVPALPLHPGLASSWAELLPHVTAPPATGGRDRRRT